MDLSNFGKFIPVYMCYNPEVSHLQPLENLNVPGISNLLKKYFAPSLAQILEFLLFIVGGTSLS
jgi:hypothetical protein